MSVDESSLPFAVPTVTEEDLKAFHAKHFAATYTPACPSQLWNLRDLSGNATSQATDQGSSASHEHVYHEHDDDDGDDGLGYYADGVKRTLTDEQIAMFRHSEIHRLLLERDKENESTEGEADAHSSIRDAIVSDSDSDSGLPRGSSATTTQQTQPSRLHSGSAASSKRKRTKSNRKTPNGNEHQHYTPNRAARELDEDKSQAVELDY